MRTTMTKQPVYEMIFEYLDEHYEFKQPDNPLTRFYKNEIDNKQHKNLDGPVNSDKVQFNEPKEAAQLVTEFAKATGADLVGFTKVRDRFVFEGVEVDYNFAVVLGKEMDYDRIQTAKL